VNTPLFRLQGIGLLRDGRQVLDDLDFQLDAGQRIGLSGANGSGKTSLLHLLVGLQYPNRGVLQAFGAVRRHEADFQEVRRRAGLLFQDPEDQLFCPTVAEDVAFGPLNLGKSHAETRILVEQTLADLGIDDYAQRVTYRLSGGEKRLVSLAAVLAMQPDVLLLDEPTGGLDPAAIERLALILEKRHEALLLVSHDQAFLQRLSGVRLHLDRGRLERL
jgi:cobalt/nickel transport system ATP-binding protein